MDICGLCGEKIEQGKAQLHHILKHPNADRVSFIRNFNQPKENPTIKDIEQYREDDLKNWANNDEQFKLIMDVYSSYLEAGDYEKYQPMCYGKYFKDFDAAPLYSEGEELTLDVKLESLIEAEQHLVTGYWQKNRHTDYYSLKWGYSSTLFHRELANLFILFDIRDGLRPAEDLDKIFQFNPRIRVDHTDKAEPYNLKCPYCGK